MKLKIKLFISLLFLPLIFAGRILAVSYSQPVGFVNDFADIYSSSFEQQLEENLRRFESETKSEIAVATVKSLEGETVEDYAVELFERWNIGKKGADNGLLLLIAVDERKIRIEVGYGLEPYITDGRAGAVIRDYITPQFRNNNYEGGTLDAVSKIQEYISTQDLAPLTDEKPDEGLTPALFYGILFGGYIFMTYIASFLGRTKAIWPGGAIGAALGAVGGLLLASFFGLIIGALVFGALGLFLDFILTKNYQQRISKGLPTGFWHTWGGLSSGGRSTRGGFGGFGGGRSGGGGSSGGW